MNRNLCHALSITEAVLDLKIRKSTSEAGNEAHKDESASRIPSIDYVAGNLTCKEVQSGHSEVAREGLGQSLGATCHVLVGQRDVTGSKAAQKGVVKEAALAVPEYGPVICEEPEDRRDGKMHQSTRLCRIELTVECAGEPLRSIGMLQEALPNANHLVKLAQ